MRYRARCGTDTLVASADRGGGCGALLQELASRIVAETSLERTLVSNGCTSRAGTMYRGRDVRKGRWPLSHPRLVTLVVRTVGRPARSLVRPPAKQRPTCPVVDCSPKVENFPTGGGHPERCNPTKSGPSNPVMFAPYRAPVGALPRTVELIRPVDLSVSRAIRRTAAGRAAGRPSGGRPALRRRREPTKLG